MNNGTIEKKKILLVDDDDIQLTIAEISLKDEYEIYKARSGNEALKLLYNKEFTPSLIVLDIIMPNMDGWEVFNRIRTISFLKNVPIVFLTSIEGETEKRHAYEIGITDYITKPFNDDDLRKRIKEIIRRKEK
jgi:DNA-binding response OmpR family regulator